MTRKTTVTVSCSRPGGRYRAGKYFAYGSGSYDLTAAEIRAVKADPYLAVATADEEAEATAAQITAALGGLTTDALHDLLQDVATAYNEKAETEGGEFVTLEFGPLAPKAEDRKAQKRGKAGQQGGGKGKDTAETPKGQEGGKGAKAGAKAEGEPIPEDFPHAAEFEGLSLADIRGMIDAGTLAAHPGMTAAKAAEVAEALEGLEAKGK